MKTLLAVSRSPLRFARPLFAAMMFAVAGCGTTSDGGSPCTRNSDCGPGLSCIADVAVNADGFCTAAGTTQCSKQCVTDAECTRTAPVCRTTCSGTRSCFVK